MAPDENQNSGTGSTIFWDTLFARKNIFWKGTPASEMSTAAVCLVVINDWCPRVQNHILGIPQAWS